MTYSYAGLEYDPNYLAHHGIKGQKWGIRRFQNPDGTLTPEGRKRYGYDVTKVNGRSLRKQFTRAKESGKLKNFSRELRSIENDIGKTNEYKTLKEINDKYAKIENEVHKVDPTASVAIDPVDRAMIGVLMKQYQEIASSIIDKHRDQLSEAILKDLDYEDTKKGREYIDKKLLMRIPFIVA